MPALAHTAMSHPRPLVALFYARLGDSRLAEFEAVWQRHTGAPVAWCWDPRPLRHHGGDVGPRIVQWLPPLPEAQHRALADTAARSVTCRGVFEVWGHGRTLAECAEAAARVPTPHIRDRIRGSWKVESAVLGARHSAVHRDLGARMVHFGAVLDALTDRPVDLHTPHHRIWLVEDRQLLHDKQPLPEPPPPFLLLYQLPARAPSIQQRLHQLALDRRAFLSTSTLPPARALQLCNLALAHAPRSPESSADTSHVAHTVPSTTLLDPYCGSGGILLAAAALGARTVGSDLDWRMVSNHPWPVQIPPSAARPDRGVEAVRMHDNFEEADLPPPGALLELDVSAPDAAARLLAANGGQRFDALVCDPPYGRREFQRGERAWRGELTFRVDAATLAGTIRALLQLADHTLASTGRLVCLVPVRSPKDLGKPTPSELALLLDQLGERIGLTRIHVGVEAVHRGLHRAVVVMERREGPQRSPGP